MEEFKPLVRSLIRLSEQVDLNNPAGTARPFVDSTKALNALLGKLQEQHPELKDQRAAFAECEWECGDFLLLL